MAESDKSRTSAGRRFATLDETAAYVRRTVPALQHLVRQNRVPHRLVEGRLVFDLDEIDAWVEGAPGRSAAELQDETTNPPTRRRRRTP